MRKKILLMMLPLLSLSLSGCGLFKTFEVKSEDKEESFSNVYELKSGKAYVWDDHNEQDIRNDLKQDREGSGVFFPCPTGDINFAGDELSDICQYPRSIWMSGDFDKNIPTVTGKNALIYISDTKVPEDIVFERFADYGYTIGVANMTADPGGHYYILYARNDEDDYKYYVDLKSDAKDVTQFKGIERLYLDKVGGERVDEENVTDGGTVMGLTKDKSYACEFYTGTFYQDFKLKADVRTFGSLERFVCHDYEFLHANCIRIIIPEWFKSGYYFVEGVGLFRYVSDDDIDHYDGSAYDPDIDWNDPIKQYDEYGVCIYDPSLGIGEEVVQESDEGLSEEEIFGNERSDEDGTYESDPLDSDSP